MNTTKTAVKILAEAERRLCELVGLAAGEGDYDSAVQVATLAKELSALRAELCAGRGQHATDNAVPPARDRRRGADDFSESAAPPDAGTGVEVPLRAELDARRTRSKSRRSRRVPKKGEYPTFSRQGDELVKVAWSKKQRGEYRHRAPRRVAELLAAAIAKRAGNSRLFTSEDIFPLKDPEDDSEVPSYQAYAALAWFKAVGLVEPHGRRGYTAGKQGRLVEALTAAWEALRESRV